MTNKDNDFIGGIIFTDGRKEQISDPLLLFVFVLDDYRGEKFANHLISKSLLLLKERGFRKVQLWVNLNNKAVGIYAEIGFRMIKEDRSILYYHKPESDL